MLNDLKKELQAIATPEKAKASAWFFKPGYSKDDKFLGVTVPQQRVIAKKYKDLALSDIEKLLSSPWHEERLTALFILVSQYKKGDSHTKKDIAGFYHKNRVYVNNWDLVDSSAPHILGDYLTHRSRTVLVRLAGSKSIWDRRIAMLSTFSWIKQGDFNDAFKIAEILINDSHDLIQKAVGWMLREIGNQDKKTLTNFLDKHAATMPRTTLRYAIEKFSLDERTHYMSLAAAIGANPEKLS